MSMFNFSLFIVCQEGREVFNGVCISGQNVFHSKGRSGLFRGTVWSEDVATVYRGRVRL